MSTGYIEGKNGKIRTGDGMYIPFDTRNREYRKYQAWIAAGNTPEVETVTLDEAKQSRIRVVGEMMETAISEILASYTESEIKSWPEQTFEARQLESNPEADAPLLSELASRRNLTLVEMKTRVLEKAVTFSRLSGNIIGQKQAIMEAINTASTVDEVNAIDITISPLAP